MDHNNVSLVGRLADNVEYTPASDTNKISRVIGKLAVNRPPGQAGNSRVDYIPFVAWGVHADNIAKYTQKGKELAIGGRIQTNSVPPKNDTDKWRTYTEIVVSTVSFGRDSNQAKVMAALQGAQAAIKVEGEGSIVKQLTQALVSDPALKLKLEEMTSLSSPKQEPATEKSPFTH